MRNNITKITIVGAGYVGMSLSILLGQKNEITVLDKDQDKINLLKKNISPIEDEGIKTFWKEKKIKIQATSNKEKALKDAHFVVVCTPTNYDESKNNFDTSSVVSVVEDVKNFSENISIIIKSTIPVGFTEELKEKYKSENIFFCPEFLREGQALHDNLNPSRIIISSKKSEAIKFTEILSESATKKDIPILFMPSREAEAVKLFSNAYLAMRVAFFNEIDNYSLLNNLDPKSIIEGMSHDERIGHFYNNPSFGYGGYCLPKDTKQLLANFERVPQKLIQAIVESNSVRKNFIAEQIIKMHPNVVGIHRLSMKSGSDNFRSSSIIEIVNKLSLAGIKIYLYEPLLEEEVFMGVKVLKELEKFKASCDLIICNRNSKELQDVKEKIYTRDLFWEN